MHNENLEKYSFTASGVNLSLCSLIVGLCTDFKAIRCRSTPLVPEVGVKHNRECLRARKTLAGIASFQCLSGTSAVGSSETGVLLTRVPLL